MKPARMLSVAWPLIANSKSAPLATRKESRSVLEHSSVAYRIVGTDGRHDGTARSIYSDNKHFKNALSC